MTPTSIVTGVVVLGWGLAWAIRAGIGLNEPNYYDPVTAMDHAAVWTYSLALLLSAVVAWAIAGSMRSDRVVFALGALTGTAFAAAAAANALEDGFGMAALGTLYVLGAMVSLISSLVFAAALYGVRARLLSAVALALGLGYLSLDNVWLAVALLLASAWIGWRLARMPPAVVQQPPAPT